MHRHAALGEVKQRNSRRNDWRSSYAWVRALCRVNAFTGRYKSGGSGPHRRRGGRPVHQRAGLTGRRQCCSACLSGPRSSACWSRHWRLKRWGGWQGGHGREAARGGGKGKHRMETACGWLTGSVHQQRGTPWPTCGASVQSHNSPQLDPRVRAHPPAFASSAVLARRSPSPSSSSIAAASSASSSCGCGAKKQHVLTTRMVGMHTCLATINVCPALSTQKAMLVC